MNATTLESLITAAARSCADADYQALFDALRGTELYFNINPSPDGQAPASIPLVKAGPDLSAVLFFPTQTNENLNKPFGGLVWEGALEMVAAMPQADGLIVQGLDHSWVAITKDKVQALLRGWRL